MNLGLYYVIKLRFDNETQFTDAINHQLTELVASSQEHWRVHSIVSAVAAVSSNRDSGTAVAESCEYLVTFESGICS